MCKTLKHCSSSYSPRKAFVQACCFLACCAAVCSDTLAYTLSSRALRYITPPQNSYNDAPIVKRVWYRAGAPNGDLTLWPFLADMEYYYSSGVNFYYPKGYTFSTAPYLYAPLSNAGTLTVPDTWTDDNIKALQDLYNSLTLSQQAAVRTVIAGNQGSDAFFYFSYRDVGSVSSGGVVVRGPDGTPQISYPNGDGYVSGYQYDASGTLQPTYYHLVDGQAVRLDTLSNVQSSSLSYDSDTGLYSFESPDYGPQLSTIIDKMDHIHIDNIDLTLPPIPAPEVNVTVPAPEVNVTVPAPEVNVTVPAPEVNVGVTNSTDLSSVTDLLQSSNSVADSGNPNITQSTEESDLLSEVSGWHDQIPLFGDLFGTGMDFLFAKIPPMGHDLQPLTNIQLSTNPPLKFSLDFTPYSSFIAWFRAFVLLMLVVLFLMQVWQTITDSLKI